MAYLINIDTGARSYLLTHHTFGRREDSVDTWINRPQISKIHAVIEWRNDAWTIRDLSTNGVWLDADKIPANEYISLMKGHIIRFANLNDSGWRVENLQAPCDLLLPENGEDEAILLNSYHLLPDDQHPELAIYYDDRLLQWFLDDSRLESHKEHVIVPLQKGSVIHYHDQDYRLFIANELNQTQEVFASQSALNDVYFIFDLSLDEESTRLKIQLNSHEYDLHERSHHYVLLNLARHRISDNCKDDETNNIDLDQTGWVHNDLLAKELGIDLSHLNILIYRARKQISETLSKVSGLSDFVQRRNGRLRFGGQHFKIFKGGKLEGEFSCDLDSTRMSNVS